MASAFRDHSVVRLGSDGPARRAASFPGAGVVHLVVWPMLMFNYLHDGMHIENFWMTRVPILKSWFLNARRLHDIHHRSLNSKGFMDTNFGIGFYFFLPVLPDHGKAASPVQLAGVSNGHFGGMDWARLSFCRGVTAVGRFFVKTVGAKQLRTELALPRLDVAKR
jgi:hypothetical protein